MSHSDRPEDGTRESETSAHRAEPTGDRWPDRRDVVAREEAEYGGVKWGSAFFGWLTATGTAVLLVALLSAAGAAVGLGTLSGAQVAEAQAGEDAETIGLVGGIALLVVLFVAYYCGGYVAGRMARFNGARQGLAVWLWALLVAILVALLAILAGAEFNLLSEVNGFPRVPIEEGDLAAGGVVAATAALVASLAGAVVGGLAGMRFHRKVDRAGLGG